MSKASAANSQPSAKTLRATRQKRRRLLAVGTVTAVLVASGGGVAYAMTRTEGGDYRTVAAALGSVSESLDLVGTLASASRSDASFSVAGTVSGVAVSLRDTVTAGQTLATLEVSSLNDAIDEAQANVSAARETLASDLESQTTTSTTSTTDAAATATTSVAASTGSAAASGTTSGSTGASSGASSAAVTDAVKAVRAAQAALLAQYDTAVTALATTEDAITATTDVCLPFLEAALEDAAANETAADTADASVDAVTSESTSESTSETTEEPTAPLTAAEKLAAAKLALADCQSAITAVLAGQTTTDEAQAEVLTLVDDLNQSVSALQKAVVGASGSTSTIPSAAATTTAAPDDSETSGTTAVSATGGAATSAAAVSGAGAAAGGATATVASAETIVADQATIDAAVAELAIAERNLTFATLTSPIAGTVASVDLAVGDTVSSSSSSSTAVITVIGDNGFVVSTTVSLTDIAGVAVGQSAAVAVSSADGELAGTVSSIGMLNVSTSSTPSYTVQIALESTDPALLNGASAAVTVAVASLDEVLTVPTSAVHLADSTCTVDLLENGVSTSVEVTVGAVGSELTEITSGIDSGDQVILADLNAAIASTDTETDGGLSGLGGETSTELRTPPAGMGGPPAG
ncbi:HlyD family efflux transporter periplasmic adaptor subunit [Cryobacterium glaciale]|uniref:HlyD family efflux transporter periplasmic adaptor subunit n=1 Tax=Cryobacterium glaciale TaxID=1259145 RepID=A0A4R8V600_9MICO|nr:HlyD family efflux transporter periplasmic adaptor subunit [Cryobacterium glaciale]TFB77404.1 HlyD family efflux transporter periplasmic adaptor subunit [Cryobacterium glaciale]